MSSQLQLAAYWLGDTGRGWFLALRSGGRSKSIPPLRSLPLFEGALGGHSLGLNHLRVRGVEVMAAPERIRGTQGLPTVLP